MQLQQDQLVLLENEIKVCYNKVAILQNFSQQNTERCYRIAKQQDAVSAKCYNATKMVTEQLPKLKFSGVAQLEVINDVLIQAFADLHHISPHKALKEIQKGIGAENL